MFETETTLTYKCYDHKRKFHAELKVDKQPTEEEEEEKGDDNQSESSKNLLVLASFKFRGHQCIIMKEYKN